MTLRRGLRRGPRRGHEDKSERNEKQRATGPTQCLEQGTRRLQTSRVWRYYCWSCHQVLQSAQTRLCTVSLVLLRFVSHIQMIQHRLHHRWTASARARSSRDHIIKVKGYRHLQMVKTRFTSALPRPAGCCKSCRTRDLRRVRKHERVLCKTFAELQKTPRLLAVLFSANATHDAV